MCVDLQDPGPNSNHMCPNQVTGPERLRRRAGSDWPALHCRLNERWLWCYGVEIIRLNYLWGILLHIQSWDIDIVRVRK